MQVIFITCNSKIDELIFRIEMKLNRIEMSTLRCVQLSGNLLQGEVEQEGQIDRLAILSSPSVKNQLLSQRAERDDSAVVTRGRKRCAQECPR